MEKQSNKISYSIEEGLQLVGKSRTAGYRGHCRGRVENIPRWPSAHGSSRVFGAAFEQLRNGIVSNRLQHWADSHQRSSQTP